MHLMSLFNHAPRLDSALLDGVVLATSWQARLGDVGGWAVAIAMVAIGLGLVIFVHELGHFLVAKACGVRCDKFYVGFDVPIKLGWGKWGIRLPASLWKKQWGETEYGIGLIPLGGYVKMLGQDDNPGKAAEELERSQVNTNETGKILHDPRSYLAKSVPQRMAIISAGVIMNMIFAVIFAMGAYSLGVPQMPAIIDGVVPGQPAWLAGIRPGDQVLKIKDVERPRFDNLREHILFSSSKDGIPMVVRGRDGQERQITVYPDAEKQTFTKIGILGPRTTSLASKTFLHRGSAADAAGKFQPADTIVKINGHPVADHITLQQTLDEQAHKPVEVTVKRTSDPEAGDATGFAAADGPEETFTLAPQQRRRLGFVATLGKITSVLPGSPAAKAGLKIGDQLTAVGDSDLSQIDPEKLGEVLYQRSLDSPPTPIEIKFTRSGETAPQAASVALDAAPPIHRDPSTLANEQTGLFAPSLGVVYELLPVVARVAEKSAAANAGLQPGDTIVSVSFVPPKKDQPEPSPDEEDQRYVKLSYPKEATAIGPDLAAKQVSWAYWLGQVNFVPGDVSIEMKVRRGEEIKSISLKTELADNEFISDRGFLTNQLREIRSAESLGEAARLAFKETGSAMTSVLRFLKKLGDKPQLIKGTSGPIGIFGFAINLAREGIPSLLLFMTLISANLAVVNLLPIPVLDGGHLVFLAAEGIRGKPVSEKIIIPLTYVGLVLILTLIVWTTVLDTGLVSRH